MTVATALTILSLINGLLGVAKTTPEVLNEAHSLLEKVRPHVQELGVDVATEFVAAEDQLRAMG